MNRQESLFAILPRAVKAAKEGGVQVTVVNDSRYASEGDGVHCYCPTEALPILYPYSSNFEAVVEKDGSVFFAKIDDVMASIEKNVAKVSKITISEAAKRETDEEYLKRTFKDVTPEQATELLRGIDEEDKTWAEWEKGVQP